MDVTDATFQADVIDRSHQVPVVIDLWAEWCGPCKALTPVLERVVESTNGKVELVKVDVDANPAIAEAFRVQSIPAVYGMHNGQVVGGFVGAESEAQVRAFVEQLAPSSLDGPIDADANGTADGPIPAEGSIPAKPNGTATGVNNFSGLMVEGTSAARPAPATEEPEPPPRDDLPADLIEQLDSLLERVKGDADVRAQFLELLDLMGPDDPRTNTYRKMLSTRLF